MIKLDLLTADVYHPANEGETDLLLSESLSLPKVCNARRTRSLDASEEHQSSAPPSTRSSAAVTPHHPENEQVERLGRLLWLLSNCFFRFDGLSGVFFVAVFVVVFLYLF